MRAPLDCQVILLFSAPKITPRIHLRRPSVSDGVFRHCTRAPRVVRHVEGAAPHLLEPRAAPVSDILRCLRVKHGHGEFAMLAVHVAWRLRGP